MGDTLNIQDAPVAAPNSVDFLVGTANSALSAEIAVGATPGGELGNTWASPTVDATHSGSAHSAYQLVDADLTAIAALNTATYGRSLLELPAVANLRSTVFSGVITPAALTGNTNDYAPADGTASYVWRISGDAAWSLTGMVAGDPGETHILVNVGNPTLSLPHDDANSTAANRFSTAAGATVVLRSAGSLMVVYDSITARWKVLGP